MSSVHMYKVSTGVCGVTFCYAIPVTLWKHNVAYIVDIIGTNLFPLFYTSFLVLINVIMY